ncbi:hypothetical protein GCM10009087_30460 [Sphingomonas oligophenolica]
MHMQRSKAPQKERDGSIAIKFSISKVPGGILISVRTVGCRKARMSDRRKGQARKTRVAKISSSRRRSLKRYWAAPERL